MSNSLIHKIKNRKAKIAVIGLGYVGLPLCVEFAKKGFCVTGIDVDKKRVESVNKGISYIGDVKSSEIKLCVKDKSFQAIMDYRVLGEQDAIIMCVPTPLRKTKEPDISYIIDASKKIAETLKAEQLIVLESTTYPGTTDEVIQPILEKSGLKAGKDFYLAFSPERVDPGNKKYNTANIPKVIGGINSQSTLTAKTLYSQINSHVIPVSSSRVAEMVKLLENTFRSVNIALANEMAIMCDYLDIDVWEVIKGAATKPFGFMPFYPGPGIGGHCIPLDPFYLTWKSRLHGYEAKFIELAGEINRTMPKYVVDKIVDILNSHKKSINGSTVFVLGVAYKKDVGDWRESPAIEIISMLLKKGANVYFNDPYVSDININNTLMRSKELSKSLLGKSDCAVIITNHGVYDYKFIIENSFAVLDTRNATGGLNGSFENVFRL
ncbi:nucleotide sugar dehydrogenase [bacterium]|nr:nucleotide sugar dehydrogenase [bacterium]